MPFYGSLWLFSFNILLDFTLYFLQFLMNFRDPSWDPWGRGWGRKIPQGGDRGRGYLGGGDRERESTPCPIDIPSGAPILVLNEVM